MAKVLSSLFKTSRAGEGVSAAWTSAIASRMSNTAHSILFIGFLPEYKSATPPVPLRNLIQIESRSRNAYPESPGPNPPCEWRIWM